MAKLTSAGVGLLIAITLLAIFWPFVTVPVGNRGLIVLFGQVSESPLEPGFHAISPLAHVKEVNVQLQRAEAKGEAASKDLQAVHTTLVVNYRVSPAHVVVLYKDVGLEFEAKIIDPIVQDRFKSVTAGYTAEELIAKREEVRGKVRSLVYQAVQERSGGGIDIQDVLVTNFQFSEAFNHAIEQKQVAEQNALTEKNNLAKIEYQAQQRVAQAKGEAEAIRIQAASISAQGGDAYVRLKTIEKWNGQLPTWVGGGNAIPLLKLEK